MHSFIQHPLRLAWPAIILLLLVSCSKKDNILPDRKPIKIMTMSVGNVSARQAILQAEIQYLNDEKVIDHGFIIYKGDQSDERKVSLGVAAKPGLIQHNYQPKEIFRLDEQYFYNFYVETDRHSYISEPVFFSVKDFRLDQSGILSVTLGDTLHLTGDFAQLEGMDYVVVSDQWSSSSNLNIIKSDAKSLSIKIPDNLGNHGTVLTLYIKKANNSYSYGSNSLIQIRLLGRIDFLVSGPQYFADNIAFKAYGSPAWYNSSFPFKLIVGRQAFDYFGDAMSPQNLSLQGSTHRLGYFNGVDTIIAKQKLQFISPKAADFSLSQTKVYPKETISISAPSFSKYFGYSGPTVLIDSKPSSPLQYVAEDVYQFQVPALSGGIHHLSIQSALYGDIKIPASIEVESLTAELVDQKAYYFNEEVQLKGNFRTDKEYVVQVGDQELYRDKVQNGLLSFRLGAGNFGKETLKIAFVDQGWYPVVQLEKSIDISGARIDSFSPSSGYPGDIVTVKGQGFLSGYTAVMVGDIQATVLSVTDTELQFRAPSTVRRGKLPIVFEYYFFKGRATAPTFFEMK